MPAETTCELHGLSWTEGQVLTTKGENKLWRWGSVKKACEMLDGCDREVIYDLLTVWLVEMVALGPDLRHVLRDRLYLGKIRISNCSRLPLVEWDLVWSERSRLHLGRVRCGGGAFHLRSPLDHAGGLGRRMIRKSQVQEEWRSGRGRDVSLRKATDC